METIEQIKEDENYSEVVYLCTNNKRTWLWGRNIEDRPILPEEWEYLSMMLKVGKTQKDWADALFIEEIRQLDIALRRRADYLNGLPLEVKAIILNMAYNMGLTKFNPQKWPNFFAAIKDLDWKLAAAHGRDSQWFFQVGHRSARLMKSLANVKED